MRPAAEEPGGLDRGGHSAHNVCARSPSNGGCFFLGDGPARHMASGQMASEITNARIKEIVKRIYDSPAKKGLP